MTKSTLHVACMGKQEMDTIFSSGSPQEKRLCTGYSEKHVTVSMYVTFIIF